MKKIFLFFCLFGFVHQLFAYNVTTSVSPPGAGTLTATPSSGNQGDSIRLTVTVNPGYKFLEFHGVNFVEDNRFTLSDHDMDITAFFVIEPIKQYLRDAEFGSLAVDELTADSIASSNIVFSGTMTIPSISNIKTSHSTSLKSWLETYASLKEIPVKTVGSDEFPDGEHILEEDDSSGICYFYDASGDQDQTYTIVLPERSSGIYNPALMIFYLYENADDERYFVFSTDNTYSDWFPSSQPWGSATENSCWEIKWQSPPQSSEWYFMGAQEFPLDLTSQ